tara:strand:+ start:1692 stop:2378 length:687 start_codon:yes stop_codon:yes gene_type:complete
MTHPALSGITPALTTGGDRSRYPQLDPKGSTHTKDWINALISEGLGFHTDIGAFSTPITGGGNGTVVDIDQPEGIVSVADGTTLMLISAQVECHVPLLATDADEAEIILAADIASAYADDGTVTTETPVSLRGGGVSGSQSNATVASAATADITDPVLGLEMDAARITGDVQGTPATALWTPLMLNYEPKYPFQLQGPTAIYLYWGGTVAVTGFAKLSWIELPESYFS